ncbi:MAG: 30S ribosomal protein S2 [Candidatus Tectomicrobia bacterium]|uniref:Small ribosomal subunit protein uS2 n=1 Tax=Tectimicrobiota bacterium TaxID=2528274 RepID=A0A932FY00_UNCTE|nr:30S ribosomal protein S2 [Candidatus Tectomicrobia bacterium]
MTAVSMKQLLEAGAHFGHQTKRWNPKMKKYIFGSRNGIYIIDLQKTLRKLREAYEFIQGVAAQGEQVLFVGTKRQSQEPIAAEAQQCNMPYVTQRWWGGMLTNFATIRKSINRLRRLEAMLAEGGSDALSKKEILKLDKERQRLEKFLGGIKTMDRLPKAIFIVDPRKERIALHEAQRLGIPVVAIVDTNCDPSGIEYVIPSNDDAIRAIRLIASQVTEAVAEGRVEFTTREAERAEGEMGAGDLDEEALARLSEEDEEDEDAAGRGKRKRSSGRKRVESNSPKTLGASL